MVGRIVLAPAVSSAVDEQSGNSAADCGGNDVAQAGGHLGPFRLEQPPLVLSPVGRQGRLNKRPSLGVQFDRRQVIGIAGHKLLEHEFVPRRFSPHGHGGFDRRQHQRRVFTVQPSIDSIGDSSEKLAHLLLDRFWLATLAVKCGSFFADRAPLGGMDLLATVEFFDLEGVGQVAGQAADLRFAELRGVAFEQPHGVLAKGQDEETLFLGHQGDQGQNTELVAYMNRRLDLASGVNHTLKSRRCEEGEHAAPVLPGNRIIRQFPERSDQLASLWAAQTPGDQRLLGLIGQFPQPNGIFHSVPPRQVHRHEQAHTRAFSRLQQFLQIGTANAVHKWLPPLSRCLWRANRGPVSRSRASEVLPKFSQVLSHEGPHVLVVRRPPAGKKFRKIPRRPSKHIM